MLLCPADIEETKSKEILRPLEIASPAIDNVGALLAHWFESQKLREMKITLAKQSDNTAESTGGDGNGVGAVWGVTYYNPSQRKHRMQLIEVISIVPNQKIDFIIITVPHPNVNAYFDGGNPAHLTITVRAKGEATELTAKIATRLPSSFTLFKIAFYLPCFWPHLLLIFGGMAVCYPCCTSCVTKAHKRDLADQCENGLSSLKDAVEKGPQQQVMSDHPYDASPLASPSSVGDK